jgi:hypothetical protein
VIDLVIPLVPVSVPKQERMPLELAVLLVIARRFVKRTTLQPEVSQALPSNKLARHIAMFRATHLVIVWAMLMGKPILELAVRAVIVRTTVMDTELEQVVQSVN